MTGQHDWRLVPLGATAWVGAWLGTAGFRAEAGLWFASIAGTGLLIVWLLRIQKTWAAMILAFLLVTAILAGAREAQLHGSLPAQWAQQRDSGTAQIQLLKEPRRIEKAAGPQLVVAQARLLRLSVGQQAVTTRQRVVVFVTGEEAELVAQHPPGVVLEFEAGLNSVEPSSPEALGLAVRSEVRWLSGPGGWHRLIYRLRTGLREAASHSPGHQAVLVPSFIVGDTSEVPAALRDQFNVTSLSHLMAVSGTHLSLMLAVISWVGRMLGVRGRGLKVLAVASLALYVPLCGGEPSVLRASAMAVVSLSAVGTGIGNRSLRNLALTVMILMLVDPWLARAWGFSLSVAATVGLVLLAPVWKKVLSSWLPGNIAEAVSLPLSAQMMTQPIIVAMTSRVSIVGVLSNMLAAPFVAPVMILGLLAVSLVWVPPVATALAWLAGWCIQPIVWVVQLTAGLPAASVNWPGGIGGVLLCALACLIVSLLTWWAFQRPARTVTLLAVFVTGLFVRPVQLGWPGEWQVVFCDVGQGDATVLRSGPGVAVLVDAGPEPESTQSCLDSLATKEIPLLVLTHFHADHVGGAEAIIEKYRPEVVLVSPLESPAEAARQIRRASQAVGAVVVTARPGMEITQGEVRWHTVAAWDVAPPPNDADAASSVENDASIIGLAQVGDLSILLPGDAEPDGQRQALRLGPERLRADVFKLPHHGSARQDPAFFEATGATLAVASAGENNDYGHPAEAALDLAADNHMRVLRTDRDGAIALFTDSNTVQIRTEGEGIRR